MGSGVTAPGPALELRLDLGVGLSRIEELLPYRWKPPGDTCV
jgi:hypothetical protein